MAATPTSACSHQAEQIFQVHFPPDTTYSITSTMLQHDSPNMFTGVFLHSNITGPTFSESASQRITIPDKCPEIFSLILDYLRGYTIFPLNEASIHPKWVPLTKAYANLKRDANYYGFFRLEAECTKWMKRYLGAEDRQAVFYLDFATFSGKMDTQLSLLSEMILDCHLADVPLLRKRYLNSGEKNMTYGPLPWKNIFEQIRCPSDRDGVLQTDGSAFVDVAPVFLKPPRTVDDHCDERKMEYAKIHISRAVTQLILAGSRPLAMSNYLTIRFHATGLTTYLAFTASDPASHSQLTYPKDDKLIGEGSFVFTDKLQLDGYLILRSVAYSETPEIVPPKPEEGKFPLDRMEKTELEVDGEKIDWETLCEWSQLSFMPPDGGSKAEKTEENKSDFRSSEIFRTCERFFCRGRHPQQNYAVASIYGSSILIFAKTRYEQFVVPQLVSFTGITEATWERNRPIWYGDAQRERHPRKRAKRKRDPDDLPSVDGTENGNEAGEDDID